MAPGGTRTALAALSALAVAAGCASPGPGVDGTDAQQLLALYSGEWLLDPDESQDPEARIQEAMAARFARQKAIEGRPDPWGAGSRGGGFAAWGRGGPGAPVEKLQPLDPEALSGALSAPDKLSLSLTPETVAWAAGGRDQLLVLGGGAVVEDRNGVEVSTRADWDDGRLRIRRKVEGGPRMTQVMEPSDDGARLLVVRTVELDGATVDAVFGYGRSATGPR